MDSDTTTRPGDSERILRGLDRGEIDILIGTQMITKGHDFPAITLVGVVAADASLNIPDFRAAERTFQILTQVSGRGGRGDQPGRVITQTFNPGHYAVRRAQEHDYAGFYADELPLRRQLAYPPFSRLIGLHFSSLKKEEGKRAVAKHRRPGPGNGLDPDRREDGGDRPRRIPSFTDPGTVPLAAPPSGKGEPSSPSPRPETHGGSRTRRPGDPGGCGSGQFHVGGLNHAQTACTFHGDTRLRRSGPDRSGRNTAIPSSASSRSRTAPRGADGRRRHLRSSSWPMISV